MEKSNLPPIEIADIFRQYDHLLDPMPNGHWTAVQAIKNCRTGALGGHLLKCDSCPHEKYAYHSCRSRFCPKCGYTARTEWVAKRTQDLLPCPYFHVVFTLPSELRALVLRNKELSYGILFRAASSTLKQVAHKNLNIEVGLIGVLHTWSQTLIDHPHIHCVVPGGGLTKNQKRWKVCSENYLLPVDVLGEVFRGKILEYFEAAYDEGEMKFTGQIEYLKNPSSFKDLLITCASKKFNIYCKKPFAGPEQVLNYLGQYTHRIAISNYRILKLEGGRVHFKYRDPKDPAKKKVMQLEVKEFMRRFLLHILPKGFVRIRHFGLLANRFKKAKIAIVRKLAGKAESCLKTIDTWRKKLEDTLGITLDKCPKCQKGSLQNVFTYKAFYNTA